MKRIIGSVSYLASETHSTDLVDNVTNKDIKDVRHYLSLDIMTSDIEKDKKIKTLIRKLMPYSKPLDGTAPIQKNSLITNFYLKNYNKKSKH